MVYQDSFPRGVTKTGYQYWIFSQDTKKPSGCWMAAVTVLAAGADDARYQDAIAIPSTDTNFVYQIGITKSGYQDGLPRNYIKTPTICLVRIDIELRFQVRVYKTQYQDAIQDTKAGYQYGYQVEIQRRHQDTKM